MESHAQFLAMVRSFRLDIAPMAVYGVQKGPTIPQDQYCSSNKYHPLVQFAIMTRRYDNAFFQPMNAESAILISAPPNVVNDAI